MNSDLPRSLPARLLLPLALAALAGCSRCGARPPAGKATAAADGAPAAGELATLELPGLPPPTGGLDAPQAEAFANREGSGGTLVVRTPSSARLVFRRTVSPEYDAIEQVTISPDGRRAAFVAASGGKLRLVLDGEAGPEADEIDGLVFGRDSLHLACRVRQGEAWRLGVDRALGEPRRAITAGPRLAAAGAAFLVGEQVAAGGPFALASYDAGLRRTVLRELAAVELALDERAVTAAAVVEAGGRRKVVAFSTGSPGALREGPAFDRIEWVGFDESGAHVLYGAAQGAQQVIVVDGRAEPLPPGMHAGAAVFNPSRGNAAVVLAKDGTFVHVAFDRRPSSPKRYEGVTDPVFSPDGNRLAFVAQAGGRSFLVVDGSEGPRLDRIVSPRFSPDGRFIVYRAREAGERFVVVSDAGGKLLARHPSFEQVLQPVFAPDGSAVSYAVKEGPRLVWKEFKL